ncbi:hypothetical protein [Mycobacterium sp. GA-1841]|nr:hypothetical protein [Mycobacterium sp. GA-1841]
MNQPFLGSQALHAGAPAEVVRTSRRAPATGELSRPDIRFKTL